MVSGVKKSKEELPLWLTENPMGINYKYSIVEIQNEYVSIEKKRENFDLTFYTVLKFM